MRLSRSSSTLLFTAREIAPVKKGDSFSLSLTLPCTCIVSVYFNPTEEENGSILHLKKTKVEKTEREKKREEYLYAFSCTVSPQHVGTGNPNCTFSYPSGTSSTGVEWSFANFSARLIPVPVSREDERDGEEFMSR